LISAGEHSGNRYKTKALPLGTERKRGWKSRWSTWWYHEAKGGLLMTVGVTKTSNSVMAFERLLLVKRKFIPGIFINPGQPCLA
jgi:hypothetical protein